MASVRTACEDRIAELERALKVQQALAEGLNRQLVKAEARIAEFEAEVARLQAYFSGLLGDRGMYPIHANHELAAWETKHGFKVVSVEHHTQRIAELEAEVARLLDVAQKEPHTAYLEAVQRSADERLTYLKHAEREARARADEAERQLADLRAPADGDA